MTYKIFLKETEKMTNDPYQLLRQPTSQQNQQEPQAEPQKMTYSNAQNNKSLLSKSDLFFMLYNAGIIKFNQLERATGVPASNIDETVMLNGVLYKIPENISDISQNDLLIAVLQSLNQVKNTLNWFKTIAMVLISIIGVGVFFMIIEAISK